MLWEILEARDSARVNRIHMGGRGSMEHGTVTDLGSDGDEADWAPPGAGDRPMMLGKDTASRGEYIQGDPSGWLESPFDLDLGYSAIPR